MKRASVGEAQHHLSRLLKYVEQGEEVEITRRKKVVARLVPAPPATTGPLPDFAERTKQMFGEGQGTPASAAVDEARRERL